MFLSLSHFHFGFVLCSCCKCLIDGFRSLAESLPEFLWRIVMKWPDFNIFSDKSARIFLISPSVCPNFHGFPKFSGAGSCPPPPVSYAYVNTVRHFHFRSQSERNFKECVLILVFYSYVLVFSSYSTRMYSYFTRIYSYVTRVLLVCTCMLLVCYWYVLVCYWYVLVCYSYVLVCTCVLLVCYSYVLVWCFSHDRYSVSMSYFTNIAVGPKYKQRLCLHYADLTWSLKVLYRRSRVSLSLIKHALRM
jgi:hypothetical protein